VQALNPTLNEVALSSSGTGGPEEWGRLLRTTFQDLFDAGYHLRLSPIQYNARPKLPPYPYKYAPYRYCTW
jgi:hypothetical protein